MKKDFIKKLGFLPKENTSNIFIKCYKNNYFIEIDFKKNIFNYWWKILIWKNKIQNISKPEDWVVLECVNRLLEKWYNPIDIILEKVYPTWHWTSWRLDILVKKDWKAYLMIECKTWGKEFDKEFKNLQKNWGQLFTYFRQNTDTEFLILYTSNVEAQWEVEYKNEIVTIEESYRETSSVVDFYTRWNKFTKQNGIFENWLNAYNFESRALTLNDLNNIKEEDASFIFNRFLEILRHNTVSDKPNAFNKMFTLFLCKIYDEWTKRIDEELEFQWIEWVDNHIKFQTRLTDLYKRWMMEFLAKDITDFNDKEFNDEFWDLDESVRIKFLEKITKLRLQKNNEFAIKEVFDSETFEDNAKVLKEVIELLQKYKVRYSKKQPFLWDFFELLLTTWLKQEAGQFFTPVPIARFICKSIPISKIVEEKINKADATDLLPSTIDYAAWSGHFLTESMEEIQNIINKVDTSKLKPNVEKEIEKWKNTTFDWAWEYMYWIEKDYRLVKTAKVGCYLHWDWIATVIHWDWLDSFEKSKSYKWKLKDFNTEDKKENARFDLVLSNPPYSVSAFKWNLKRENAENDFDLYDKLTDNSSEIECLFIERTSQLLKEWWVAWIILPSSILSNTWIYTKAREIILKDFEIIAITELGSGTFMATWTNTVILFLRKRNKFFAKNLQTKVDNFFINLQDVTLNWVENPVSKYVTEVWEWIKIEDYVSLLQKIPNENIKSHEIFKDYENKIKLSKKSEEDRKKEFFEKLIKIEKEKLFYFVLTYPQKLVLVKSWEKNIEKAFLWYEFSNRKWSEWIHPIQRWRLIDACTKLFDPESIDNPQKASTYVYDSFENKHTREIHPELKDHIFRTSLVDLLTFDRSDFEKTISLNLKKKVRIESKWECIKIWDSITKIMWNITKIPKKEILEKWSIPVITQEKEKIINWFTENKNIISDNPLILFWDHSCSFKYIDFAFIRWADGTVLLKPNSEFLSKYFYYVLTFVASDLIENREKYQRHYSSLKNIKIPLPPKEIQQKIVDEIEILEKIEENNLEKIWELENKIDLFDLDRWGKNKRLDEICYLKAGKFVKAGDINKIYNSNLFPCYWGNGLRGYTKTFTNNWEFSLVGRQGALCWNVHLISWQFHATEHALVAYPKKETNNLWLHYKLLSMNLNQYTTGTAQPWLSVMNLNPIQVILPSLETQKEIVWEIEKLEKDIEKMKEENVLIPERKKEILRMYL
jgi:type I restriction enzyme M protein